ncbi:5-methyltetrahydropteroyltriglutamate--homocysteine S-methyltransferase [Desulfosporosinus sp. PR]|uniref:5-methyltetrahydropteroyltriglutamate-- homocysteine S-methyltransferase n=1 Tax=Candidatus Desulfosporosinus nitrosoreducens TaxID=3401928 RepID=UPI0027E747BF|nr:5-methyltetrahydropteroyltriglutamate--homocysteine S-methyltransferase [Desulfosporosinus sp. PR]MDQ7093770.1 5-methyltetrahydropteroyltriglutamate--homocysteine S-methyltransferase [Desulfosporosinus sp. PR]
MGDLANNAAKRATAPFRYDIVGSFLRPERLKNARDKFTKGLIKAQELKEIEDEEIIRLVEKQKASGLRAVTDGEFRRSWWHLDFLWNLDGVQKATAEHGPIAFQGKNPRPVTIEIKGKIDFNNHPFLQDFKFTRNIAGDNLVKLTIPSPSMLHLIATVRKEDYQPIPLYQNNDLLLKDISAAYKKAIKAFYEIGCRYLQLDDTSWGEFCSEEKRAAYARRGFDVDQLARDYVTMVNEAIEDRPSDMVVTMHICRGNFRSTWFSSGGYEPIAEILFANCQVDGFFLEYDSDRSGDFKPLRFIDKQKVVLGLITSKNGTLENKTDLIARIEEATQYVNIDQLCLSPQCGFASTEEGNILTEEQQWEKIALVKEVAEAVWK